MQPKQPRPSLARLTDNKFAALVRLFMSSANPRWNIPQDKGGYAHNTKDSWSRALQFAIRPDCLGDVSLQDIRPSLVQAFFDGIADKPGKQKVTLTALKQIEAWAIVRELLSRQITLGVKISKSTGGHIPWTERKSRSLGLTYDPTLPVLSSWLLTPANVVAIWCECVRPTLKSATGSPASTSCRKRRRERYGCRSCRR